MGSETSQFAPRWRRASFGEYDTGLMRSGAPRAIADLLVGALPALRERLLEREIRRSWAALVGPDVARRARPRALINGCLEVLVDNSPWLHELTLRAPELTARLHDRFGEVHSLRFVLGALPSDALPDV